MNKLFGSETRVKLLTRLLMNPDHAYYIRELSKELDIPYGMVHREIENLAELHIIFKENRGKITLIRVNSGLSYIEDLRKMFMKTTGVFNIIAGSLRELDSVKYLLVFGSYAGKDFTERSDVDLLVVGSVSEEKLLEAVKKIEGLTRKEVNYIIWTEEELEDKIKSKHHLLHDIISKPLIMLAGSEDEFRRAVEEGNRQENSS